MAGRLGPFAVADTLTTVADPPVGAFLGWRSGALHWQAGVTAFLPIGDYRRGRLANVAKNRGALDLFGALTWFDPAIGIDLTHAIGVTVNRENRATRYRTGSEFHWDWSATYRFDNGISLGPTGYHYRQLSGDSGVGARLGPFRGSAWAVGAAAGYEFRLGRLPVTARIRYFREIDTTRRLRGDAVFFGFSLPLYVPGA